MTKSPTMDQCTITKSSDWKWTIEITGAWGGVGFIKTQIFWKLILFSFTFIMIMIDTVHCLLRARYCAILVHTTSSPKLYEMVLWPSCYKWGTKAEKLSKLLAKAWYLGRPTRPVWIPLRGLLLYSSLLFLGLSHCFLALHLFLKSQSWDDLRDHLQQSEHLLKLLRCLRQPTFCRTVSNNPIYNHFARF